MSHVGIDIGHTATADSNSNRRTGLMQEVISGLASSAMLVAYTSSMRCCSKC